jgi:hypothetical protein
MNKKEVVYALAGIAGRILCDTIPFQLWAEERLGYTIDINANTILITDQLRDAILATITQMEWCEIQDMWGKRADEEK